MIAVTSKSDSPGAKLRAGSWANRLTILSCVSRNRGNRWALRSAAGANASICSGVLISRKALTGDQVGLSGKNTSRIAGMHASD